MSKLVELFSQERQLALLRLERAQADLVQHKDTVGFGKLAKALYNLGRTDEAMECAERALEMDPVITHTAHLVRLSILEDRCDIAMMIIALEDWIRARPGDADPYVYLAQVYDNYLNERDSAENVIARGAQRLPQNYHILTMQADFAEARGLTQKAKIFRQAAARVRPYNVPAPAAEAPAPVEESQRGKVLQFRSRAKDA